MQSNFLLSIKDKELAKDFILTRNKEITIISAFLLFERFIFGVVLLSAFLSGKVSATRLGL